MTDHEIDHLAKQFKPVVVPGLAPFLEKDGKPVGFALALPDLNVVFRKNRNGRLFPVALKPSGRSDPEDPAAPIRCLHRPNTGAGLDAILYH
jgi:hypothetical protein